MWMEEADEFFKGYLPYYVLVFLPIFILVSPASPVSASHEFPVYRMQHYDINGFARGTFSPKTTLRSAIFSEKSRKIRQISRLSQLH